MHAVSLEPVCLPWTALAEMLAICLIVSLSLTTGHAKHPSPQSLLRLYLVHRPLRGSEETADFFLLPFVFLSHEGFFPRESQFQLLSFHFSLRNLLSCFVAIIRPTTMIVPCTLGTLQKECKQLWLMGGFHEW
ncbi:ATP synthase subunit gamma mitochondrial [Zea mays]|uniref:ATP synthase subunit gamma mitochondrial n=2 Tax=Zea mays TaxID=4577 RepID=B4FZE6_MAIZE|nr:ATP synthase subunit gamma mitochondrial [Zea mays]ACF87489.1 unknown [Zea mays]AQL08705.1 ATP synthase subunit gamma mitochondrial [Zea mays]|eukprot:NP_001142018.1 uncharacterized protein LOC100274172 [Zea mays]